MKLTKALLLVLGASLCLAKDANNAAKAHPLVNRTQGNMTHPAHPIHSIPHNNLNATDNSTAHHGQKDHKAAPGKNLRGHGHGHHQHQKPAEGNNATKPAEPEENNEEAQVSEEAQVNEEASVVAEQGEDAEEELARLLADQKVRKNKRGAQRRGHKNGKHGKRHHAVKPEDLGENAEGVIGGEDAEDIESELRRLLPQTHQGKGNNKKGGRPHWKKPQVKPVLKPEDFEFFGEHHIFGEDAFENGEGFGFGWNHHKKH